MAKKRIYCPYCNERITIKDEAGIPREYCISCDQYFYNNPLPVVSTIVAQNRDILLVKRRNDPYKGEWCLPMGFAESGESAEEAALRELVEETGLYGDIIDFILVDTGESDVYGDLLFLTFEVEPTGGKLEAGDDAIEVKYFPLNEIPELAFQSNANAIEKYIRGKEEYWAIVDSFTLSSKEVRTLFRINFSISSNPTPRLLQTDGSRMFKQILLHQHIRSSIHKRHL